jgi:flagellar biosynthetic protein FlhB
METPIVVAKGTGAFAKRISALARENGVPVLERKPLARALFASVEVNHEIPVTLYKAIAEILAYVYGLKQSA